MSEDKDFFDIAIEEGLQELSLYDEHVSSVDGMAAFLVENGWAELLYSSDESDLFDFYDMMSTGASISRSRHWDGVFDSKPNILQFFFDLYGFGSERPFSDVLVSYLHENESRPQNYEIYSSDSISDIQFFISSIQRSPALIYCGGFQLAYRGNVLSPTTRRENMRSLNGVCVDVDAGLSDDGKHPVSPEVLPALLCKIPLEFSPSYICLTGNGFHLWWVFSESLQTFGPFNPRREKFSNFIKAFYQYVRVLSDDLPAEVDFACSPLNHGFRAPGSQTKYFDTVRAFCLQGRLFSCSSLDPVFLSGFLKDALGDSYPGGVSLTEDDVRYKTVDELERESRERKHEFLTKPATDKQLSALQSFSDSGLLTSEESEGIADLTASEAHLLIDKASKRIERYRSDTSLPSRPSWRTQPHYHISGSTGGIYRIVLENVQNIPVGKRYLSLYMLAGIAFYMRRPAVTREDLRRDLQDLLKTPWARASRPLSQRDVDHALLGYTKENYQTRAMIEDMFGYDIFAPPSKRNGRSRSEHLAVVARPAYAKKSRDDKVLRMVIALSEEPEATKKRISEMTGISYPTVLKYWDEAMASCGSLSPSTAEPPF